MTIKFIETCSIKPLKLIASMEVHPQKMTRCESLATRALFVAQMVISTLALPIILLLGLGIAAARTFKGEGIEALKEMGNCLKYQIILGIPVGAYGIFASFTSVSKFFDSQVEKLNHSVVDPYQPEEQTLAEDITPIPSKDPKSKDCIEKIVEMVQYTSHYN